MYRNHPTSHRTNPVALLPVLRRSRSRRRLAQALVSILVITSMLLSPFHGVPFSSSDIALAQPANGTSQLPPPAERRTAPAWVDPQLPSLVIDLDVAPRVISVGDRFTVTLRINNQSPHPANNLAVTLPLPAGAVGHPNPQPNGWSWRSARLDGGSSTTMRATLRLVQVPPGNAVLVRPQATAQGLSLPVTEAGGALVVQRDLAAAVAPFTPGVGAVLRSADGRVEVRVPPDAADRPLTLRHSLQPGGQNQAVPSVIGFKRAFPAFYLNATDAQGRGFHEFSKPLTVTVSYTPQQLEALGLTEEYLSLFWYDESQQSGGAAGRWVPWPTIIDPRSHTITASITHFSGHGLGEDFRPSDAYLPSLKEWQVGLFRGDVSFDYELEVPEGPAGIKPELKLTYNSSQTDGPSGMKAKHQSGWTGKGWSLDTGYIAFNKLKYGTATDPGHYSLVLNGQTYDLMRAEPLVGSPSLTDPTDYAWRTTYESFNRIRALGNGNSTAQRGGFKNDTAYPRQKWQVWSKDGTRFEFEEDAWWGWSDCAANGEAIPEYSAMETYKWHLSKVVDTHGNVITYTYGRKTQPVTDNCGAILEGVVDYDVWPSQITWAGALSTGDSPRYKVTFTSIDRTIDTQAEQPSNQIGTNVRETQQLEEVEVWSNRSNPYNSSAWERIRRYDLIFQGGDNWQNYLLSDVSKCDPTNTNCGPDTGTRKLTLKEIRQFGSDNTTYLPPISFTYWLTRGTDLYPQGAWNRLWKADNNQGGVVTFEYQTIGSTFPSQVYAKHYKNNRRATSRILQDGRGNSYTWTYEYQDPAYNSLGTELTSDDSGPNRYPSSASVYYSEYQDPNNRAHNRALMVHKRNHEFRGHSYVKETDPNGDQIEHWFYQGNYGTQGSQGCYPLDGDGKPLTGEAILTDTTCFQPMRDREFLKGREWKTIRHEGAIGANSKLLEVLREFDVKFYEHGDTQNERLTGLWRAFPYERRTTDTAWERGVTSLTKSVEYTYDISDTETLDFGNQIATKEYNAGTVLREITQTYKVLSNTTSYIADRVRAQDVKDGQGQLLARTLNGYDGSHGGHEALTKGDLTLVRKYFTVAPDGAGKIYSSDMSYTYDDYGNRLTVTTYDGPGDASANDTSWSPPGGNNPTPRTQLTEYDSRFNVFPVRITETIASLVTGYDYDYRMGTMSKETDYNGIDTEARYDEFNRMTKLVKHGDNFDFPTGLLEYYDWERPVKYVMGRREVAGTNAYRPTVTFYDGMGREIQTKSESINDAEQIVEDKRYDGLGQVIQQSQPRYVNDSANFWNYVPPSDPLYRATRTSYDAAGRKTRVEEPAPNIYTTMDYAVIDARRVVTTTDPNRHITRHDSDMFGRLIAVKEYSGNGGTEGQYSLYATTSYGYSPLDLLTVVTDTRGKLINVQYDALGRKKEMTDIAMGQWTYTYDPNGNLKTQTDPKSQTLTFGYDALDRLTSKTYPGGATPERAVYTYDQGTNGKGLRTKIERLAAGTGAVLAKTEWQYDERGRKKRAEHTIANMPGTRVFQWGYDSADRNTTITYPTIGELGTSEVVTYGYDAAWRPISLCSSLYSPCYVNNTTPYTTTYTALGQPERIPLGNDVINRYTYADPMQRLSQIRVGTGAAPASVFSRSYDYDNASNVTNITHVFGPPPTTETQTFGYDHRDRLTSWVTSGINPANNETYSYDELGNLQTKAGSTYDYNYGHARGGGGPYAVRTVTPPTGQAVHYTYDNNGNLTDTDQPGRTRHYEWNADNLPTLIERNGANGVTEAYLYDADGERVRLVKGPQNNSWSTFYMEGLWDEQHNNGNHVNTHTLYTFNGQIVAQREYWPHGDAPKSGLRGDYFNNDDLTNFEATKYDASIDFNWGAGSPDVRVENGRFSIEWTGLLDISSSGSYTFATEADGGVRLWVNDTLLIDNWTDSGTLSSSSGQITLDGGKQYSIKLQYFDQAANAEIHLKWQPPGTGRLEVVPDSQFSPPEADLLLPPARNELSYFHTDHLGSISVATDADNAHPARRQEFDPWGKVRHVPSPNLHNTTLNYTGQRLDGSNLLYYHARYYDPQLGRFVSADSIVPGVESGKGGAAASVGAYQNHKLTVDFHEPGFARSLREENSLILEEGFWAEDRKIDGPINPQALNRYAYVLNNPVRYTDPSGHGIFIPIVLAILGSIAFDVATDAVVACFTEDCSSFDLMGSIGNSVTNPWTYTGPVGKLAKVVQVSGKIGKVIGFVNKSGKAVKTNIGTKALEHSFDEHATQWFGTYFRNLSKTEYLPKWKQLIETATEKGRQFESSNRGTPTMAFLYREGNRYFVAHYHRDTGEFVTAFVPDPEQINAYWRTIRGK